MGCFACFDGGKQAKLQREKGRLASLEARSKAAEAAQKRTGEDCVLHQANIYATDYVRESIGSSCSHALSHSTIKQEQFEKSAAGKAARAQVAAAAKQSASSNKGEPVLKWQMG